MEKLKIALIHDYLLQYGGAEKTLEAIIEIFPEAEIYTSIYRPSSMPETIKKMPIHAIKNGILDTFAKYITFLMPFVFESFDLRKYDIVISDSSAWAKGVLTTPEQLHIGFIHNPPRFLYGYSVESTKRTAWYFKPFVTVIDAGLRVWDRAAAQRPDFIAVNSQEIQKRVKKFYGRDSVVINPPVEVNVKANKYDNKGTEYFVVVGRLVAYKNFDLVIKAFNELPDMQLIVIGGGCEERRLKKMAGPNIKFLGKAPDMLKHEVMQGAKGLINAISDEDFGIVPIEAMGHGIPVLAHKSGGHLETVIENKTGMFFDEESVPCLRDAIVQFNDKINSGTFNPDDIMESVQKYSKENFKEKFKKFVFEKWQSFNSR